MFKFWTTRLSCSLINAQKRIPPPSRDRICPVLCASYPTRVHQELLRTKQHEASAVHHSYSSCNWKQYASAQICCLCLWREKKVPRTEDDNQTTIDCEVRWSFDLENVRQTNDLPFRLPENVDFVFPLTLREFYRKQTWPYIFRSNFQKGVITTEGRRVEQVPKKFGLHARAIHVQKKHKHWPWQLRDWYACILCRNVWFSANCERKYHFEHLDCLSPPTLFHLSKMCLLSKQLRPSGWLVMFPWALPYTPGSGRWTLKNIFLRCWVFRTVELSACPLIGTQECCWCSLRLCLQNAQLRALRALTPMSSMRQYSCSTRILGMIETQTLCQPMHCRWDCPCWFQRFDIWCNESWTNCLKLHQCKTLVQVDWIIQKISRHWTRCASYHEVPKCSLIPLWHAARQYFEWWRRLSCHASPNVPRTALLQCVPAAENKYLPVCFLQTSARPSAMHRHGCEFTFSGVLLNFPCSVPVNFYSSGGGQEWWPVYIREMSHRIWTFAGHHLPSVVVEFPNKRRVVSKGLWCCEVLKKAM